MAQHNTKQQDSKEEKNQLRENKLQRVEPG
jgi:hypothetical protein